MSTGDPLQQPAEWQQHAATWLAWPCDVSLWGDDLVAAQQAVADLARAIAPGESVQLLCPAGVDPGLDCVTLRPIPYGDIWLRDTGPIFVTAGSEVEALTFAWNGWGKRYQLLHDDQVALRVAEAAEVTRRHCPWVLEGGAIDTDGAGTLLTTRQCLLNPNRNPSMDQAAIEQRLRDDLAVERIHWLGEGLINDHTDGHVDTIARFVAPHTVVCMEPAGTNDPNRDALETIARDLAWFADARGRRLEVVRIPSPGAILDSQGELMPASYVNFYICNAAVAVPTYGVPQDDAAVEAIQALFPTRKAVAVPARGLLTGGGALHCISKEQPVSEHDRD